MVPNKGIDLGPAVEWWRSRAVGLIGLWSQSGRARSALVASCTVVLPGHNFGDGNGEGLVLGLTRVPTRIRVPRGVRNKGLVVLR